MSLPSRVVLLALLSLASIASADEQEVREEIERAADAYDRAIAAKDADALAALFDDEGHFVDEQGEEFDKAGIIAFYVDKERTWESARSSDRKVRVLGDSQAVESGEFLGVGTFKGAPFRLHTRYVDVWIKKNGRWVVIEELGASIANPHDAAGSAPAEAAGGRPGSEKLAEFFVGDWTYEGSTDARLDKTPYGPAGSFQGQTSTRFVLDGSFAEEHWAEKYPSGEKLSGIDLFAYDENAKQYISHEFQSQGQRRTTTLKFQGDTVTWESAEVASGDQKSLARGVSKYTPDRNAFHTQWELSFDDGQTWEPWFEMRGTRVKR